MPSSTLSLTIYKQKQGKFVTTPRMFWHMDDGIRTTQNTTAAILKWIYNQIQTCIDSPLAPDNKNGNLLVIYWDFMGSNWQFETILARGAAQWGLTRQWGMFSWEHFKWPKWLVASTPTHLFVITLKLINADTDIHQQLIVWQSS